MTGFHYLASPYTHSDPFIREFRYLRVCEKVSHYFLKNIVVYSPIVHWHEVAKMFAHPPEHGVWLLMDETMIQASIGVIVMRLAGWNSSKGVQHEIEFAKSINKSISYTD